MTDMTDIQAVIDTARAGVEPKVLAEGPGFKRLYVPGHGDHASVVLDVDLRATLAAPTRKTGTTTVFDAASFNSVIKDNSDAGNIAIYVNRDPAAPAIEAVLNGHGKGGPGWSDFRAKIEFARRRNGEVAGEGRQVVEPGEFAEFVEDNLDDIAAPPRADFLEIVSFLQATRTNEFKSGVRLSSGAIQFQNLETSRPRSAPVRSRCPRCSRSAWRRFSARSSTASPSGSGTAWSRGSCCSATSCSASRR